MLTFVFGRSGYGKTEFVFNKINEIVKGKRETAVLICPEQFSFNAEKRLLAELGEANYSKAPCFSLSRLSIEAKRLYGTDELETLTVGGKAVLMKEAIEGVSDKLTLFKKSISSYNFVSSMMRIYDEMKSCDLSSDKVLETSTSLKETKSLLSNKLYDISLIMASYEKLIKDKFNDPKEELTRLYKRLHNKGYFKDKTVLIDGFNGFVAQEYKIIEIIIEEAKEVYITLDTDSYEADSEYDLFAYVNSTAKIISKIAKKEDIVISTINLTENKRTKSTDLEFLEKEIFSLSPKKYENKVNNIEIYSSKNVTDECSFVSRKIKSLLRNGYRARDIAVICRNIDKYKPQLESSFKKYEVPYFVDKRQAIASQPIIVFCRYLLRTVIYSLRTEDILSLAKTGLTDLTDEEINKLENYTFMWNISGSKWKEDFLNSTKGYVSEITENDQKNIDALNVSRKKLIFPILNFKNAVKSKNANDICTAIYNALIEFHCDKKLSQNAYNLFENGNSVLAKEQGTSWDLLMSILDELYVTLNEKTVAVKEFSDVFSLILASEELGVLPQGIDNIQFGQADRMRMNNPRAVFVLGANEGEFPQNVASVGILTDNERKLLSNNDFKLYSYGEILSVQEKYFAYKAVSSASEKLFVCYNGNVGKDSSPSIIINSLKEIFENIKETNADDYSPLELIESRASAFEFLCENYLSAQNEVSTAVATLKEFFKDDNKIEMIENIIFDIDSKLEPSVAASLYKNNMLLSASRIEDYYNCRFKYFCKFGLGARTRQKAEINPMQRGNLVHFVLEKLLSDVVTKALTNLTHAEIRELVDKYTKIFFEKEMGNITDVTERFKYNYNRLTKLIYSVVYRLSDEFSKSDFEAKAFEYKIDYDGDVVPKIINLDDGGSIAIRGSIDRVDVMTKNDKQYVRVVDYKTGNKDFVLRDVVNGLNLQMFLYLFCLSNDKKCKYSGIPSGVLYLHSSRPLMSVDIKKDSKEAIKLEEDKTFRAKGIILDDEENSVAKEMENDLLGKYIPVKLDKNENLTGSIATLEELGLLNEKINKLVFDMGVELHSGVITQNPVNVKYHDKTCEYCDFLPICSMKNKIEKRTYEELSDSEIKSMLKEEKENAKMD